MNPLLKASKMSCLLLALSALAFGALAGTAAAESVPFEVNDETDAPLANPGGQTCISTAGGSCTLRAAIQAADNLGGNVTITLPEGDYRLTIAPSSAEDPTNGDLDITGGSTNIAIIGAGAAGTIIDANGIDRAFAIHSGEKLAISGVTVRGGAQPGTAPSNTSTGSGHGGAFYNEGTLTVDDSVLTGNSAGSKGGVVYAAPGASETSILKSTVTNNAAGSLGGGALYVEGGSVTLIGDTITHNSASDPGGALYDYADTEPIQIDATTISHNSAESDGGALDLEKTGTLTVSNSTLDSNTSAGEEGGAIYDRESQAIIIEHSTLSGNTNGSADGGAVYASGDSSLTVTGSTFDNDTAGEGSGGALDVGSTNLSIEGSTFGGDVAGEGGALYIADNPATATESVASSSFIANSATDSAGGAIQDDEGNLTISGSTLSGNSASDTGGGLYDGGGDSLTLTNDTIDGNQAGGHGGGIDLNGSPSNEHFVTFLNDTIARNTAYAGGGIYEPSGATSIRNTIVADNTGGVSIHGGGDCSGGSATDNAGQADGGGNIDSDGTCFSNSFGSRADVDPLLGPLAANGGPTETDALLLGSPALGAGGECPSEDQRGTQRVGGCDSGAYQAEPADVAITVSAPSSVTVGAPLSYTLSVKDEGPGVASGVTVSDTLPAGTTYYGSSSSQGTCSGTATVTCALGALSPSATATVTIVILAGEAGSPRDTATVSADEEDPQPANNTGSATATVTSAARVERVETIRTVNVDVVTGSVAAPGTASNQCKSTRSEMISWKVATGVHLAGILITRNGTVYRTLPGSAREATVSMVGLPKGTVVVRISAVSRGGIRYAGSRTFHLCVAAKRAGRVGNDYLRRV